MARYHNTRTGAVVNVDDVTAARLGPEWTPLAQPAPQQSPAAPAPRRTRKK